MARRGLNRIGSLMDGFTQAYDAIGRVTTDAGLRRIAESKPEDFQQYSPDQAAQLEAAANAKDADGNPLYNVQANEGGTYSVTPIGSEETGTMTPGLTRSMFRGQTYDKPPSDAEQLAIKSNAMADVISQRDPVTAMKLRVAGFEAKKAGLEDIDQQAIRAAWNDPSDMQPIRGLRRIDTGPATGSNTHGTMADPKEADDALASLGTGGSNVAAGSTPLAQAQAVPTRTIDPSQAANADLAFRRVGGREAGNAFIQRKAPQLIDAYLRAGKIDQARAFRAFVDSEDGRAYTNEWAHGVRALEAGDYLTAIDTYQRMYNSQRVPDGNTVKLTPSAGGLNYTAEIYNPDGQLLNSVTKPTRDIAKHAAVALAPEKMAEFMAQQQGKREAEGALLDRQIQLEQMRQSGSEAREDRRDDRLGMRLDAQSEMLDRRLSTGGGLSVPQQRTNESIIGARRQLSGMTRDDVLAMTQAATATGRPNPNYSPQMANTVRLANQRLYGDDPAHDAHTGSQQRPAARTSGAGDTGARFAADPRTKGYRLGPVDPKKGLPFVLNESGQPIGWFE